MPCQFERQLHAGRELRKSLIDAEFVIKRAVEMPQHDCGRNRRVAGMKRYTPIPTFPLSGGRHFTIARGLRGAGVGA